MDLVANLHGERAEDDQTLQEDKDGRRGVLLEMLARKDLEFG